MTTRRKFIFQIVPAAAAVTLLGRQAMAAALPKLTDANPAAKALGYIADTQKVDAKKFPTHKVSQDCGNCIHYTSTGKTAGTCALFKGFEVEKVAWCRSWVEKKA